jgi:hypothetical protein
LGTFAIAGQTCGIALFFRFAPAYDGRVAETHYFLFRSFRAALVITGTAAWVTAFTIRNIGSQPTALLFRGTRLAFYPYVMSGFTAVVLVSWIVKSPGRLEKWFSALWLGTIAVGCVPLLNLPRTYFVARCAMTLLELAATFVALTITIEIARPLYREARLARETLEKRLAGRQ